ncbi:MAG: histidine kinase [Pseudomonadota bacterium]
MLRFLAGAAACFILLTGAFLIWQSRAEHSTGFSAAQGAPGAGGSLFGGTPLRAPEASEKTREEKRFSRYDKNKDGKVQADEYLAARHRNFDKLDLDHNGALSFQEYAAKGIEKFNDAGGRKGWLTAAEFVATAPPQAKRKSTCSCKVKPPEVPDNNEDNSN